MFGGRNDSCSRDVPRLGPPDRFESGPSASTATSNSDMGLLDSSKLRRNLVDSSAVVRARTLPKGRLSIAGRVSKRSSIANLRRSLSLALSVKIQHTQVERFKGNRGQNRHKKRLRRFFSSPSLAHRRSSRIGRSTRSMSAPSLAALEEAATTDRESGEADAPGSIDRFGVVPTASASSSCSSPSSSDSITHLPQQRCLPEKILSEGQMSAVTESTVDAFDAASLGHRNSGGSVLANFRCVYWPVAKTGRVPCPPRRGHIVLTVDALRFVPRRNTKEFSIRWGDVMGIKKAVGLIGGMVDGTFRVLTKCGIGLDGDKCFVKSGLREGNAKESAAAGAKLLKSSYLFSVLSATEQERAYEVMSRLLEKTTRVSGSGPHVLLMPMIQIPDQTLKNMTLLFEERVLRNVSISRFYDLCVAECKDTGVFYELWLARTGNYDVNVGDWQYTNVAGEDFVNNWCGERYTQKRRVSFKFKRTTQLYMGAPEARVTHTQRCRVEGDDRFILQMTVEMEGIPFADTFAVEIRWVFSRKGTNDLSVSVGVHVDFKKPTMFANQIRRGTFETTKRKQLDLFANMSEVCSSLHTKNVTQQDEKREDKGEQRFVVEVVKKTENQSETFFWWRNVFARESISLACHVIILLFLIFSCFDLLCDSSSNDRRSPWSLGNEVLDDRIQRMSRMNLILERSNCTDL